MKILQTIEEAHKLFRTSGSSPLLVTCNDLRDWVCKYDRSSKNLFNELIAAKFAEIWGIRTPEIALIQVRKEHVPAYRFPNIQFNLFEKECFGSLYLESSKEIDLSLIPLFKEPGFRKKLGDKKDFLKIALYDVWLANEDRNHNNFNLLLYTSSAKLNFLYAIDHVNIFNSSYLNYGVTDITEDDSILKTELAKILFKDKRKLTQIVDNLVHNFYLCTEECCNRLDEILGLVPDSWRINKDEMKEKIVGNLFTEKWKAHCIYNFRGFVQSFIVN